MEFSPMGNVHYFAAVLALLGTAAWAESHSTEAGTIDLAAADMEAAEKIFQKSCRACHGNKAQGASSYPKLSDKEPDYIAEKLEIYRRGEKIGPNSILMIQHAKKLSDEDIVNISVYVATAFD
jgi:cytochrome c553